MRSLLRVCAARTPPYVVLFVTARCNARCRACFYWREAERPGKELTLDELSRTARSLRGLYYLTLTGGEPFLRGDLPEIARAFIELSGARHISVPTNGMLPDRVVACFGSLLDAFPRVRFRIALSVDGIGEEHDRIRGAPGSFARLEETFRRLAPLRSRHANLSVDVTTVCSRFNESAVEGAIAWVDARWRPDHHNLLLARGSSRDPSAVDVPVARYRELAAFLERREAAKPARHLRQSLLRTVKFRTRELVCDAREAERMPIACRAGSRMVVISEQGEVHPCEPLGEPLGSLRESGYDIRRVLSSDRARSAVRRIRGGACWCTYECAIQSSILFEIREYPGLLRRLLKAVAGHPPAPPAT